MVKISIKVRGSSRNRRPFRHWYICLALLCLLRLPGLAAPGIDMISDNPGMILSSPQAWGELGLNVAAHLPGQTALPLQIGDKLFAKGLGSHAAGEIVLALDGQYLRFDAEIGVQKQPSNGGTVIFKAIADGREIYQSSKLDGQTPALPISFSVAEVEELRLVVNDAGDGIICDLGNWANARLTPALDVAKPRPAQSSVDIAPFARVATWDPARKDGARANRIEEFRADDLFTETELRPRRDGTYTAPAWTNGVGCIGLQWLNSRALRELALEFAGTSQLPPPNSVRVEAWQGESAWQGNWQTLTNDIRQDNRRLVCNLAPKGGMVQTRKIRWILPPITTPPQVQLSAFTRSRWSTTNLYVEFERPGPGARGSMRVENGELSSKDTSQHAARDRHSTVLLLSRPLRFTIRYSRPSTFKSDPTVLRFSLPRGEVAVAVEDVLANDCVYLPDYGLFVAREPLPVTLAGYKQRIASKQTLLAEVRAMPDQTLSQAMAKTHHDAQREGPVLLSLACDNNKFQVDRNGTVQLLACTNPAVASHEVRLRLKPTFGDGKITSLTRKLDGGWLPIPAIETASGDVIYRQRAFVAPCEASGSATACVNPGSVCVTEFTVTNPMPQSAQASVSLAFDAPVSSAVKINSHEQCWEIVSGERSLGYITIDRSSTLNAAVGEATFKFSGTLPSHGTARLAVFLPAAPDTKLPALDASHLRTATENYWKAIFAPATQVETPDALLNDVIRSSQVRCLIDARSEDSGARVAAWIAAISYGPLESESHAVIRGMDFLGHDDFARRSLDFFVHRYNTNGFLTTGYTTFGTAWHLWTLAEHYQLTRDTNWLRQVAPEVARVCRWIVCQTEKTRKLDARGQPVPEYGLMPPGVLADWNAFAYHFTMNGYYAAALREAGRALGDIRYPEARAFVRQAEILQANTLRAYSWTQARAPALALRDGTWIPFYPSQVHSPGNLGDFFPGQDAGRSWCYNVELGAHQLVPAGVLDPHSRQVEQMMNHMEDVQFLEDGWFDYPAAMNHADWFNNGGFSKVQPYYTRNGEIYALRDDVKPFVRSYFNTIAAMLNPEVLTMWEHFNHSGAWDKTHETGYFLQQTRFMLAMDHGKELWLAPLVTSNWLNHGQQLIATGIPTKFGKVSYHLSSHVNEGYIKANIQLSARSSPKLIVLRLRHPDGKPLKTVIVNDKSHSRFDAAREVIFLRPTKGPFEVRANY